MNQYEVLVKKYQDASIEAQKRYEATCLPRYAKRSIEMGVVADALVIAADTESERQRHRQIEMTLENLASRVRFIRKQTEFDKTVTLICCLMDDIEDCGKMLDGGDEQ